MNGDSAHALAYANRNYSSLKLTLLNNEKVHPEEPSMSVWHFGWRLQCRWFQGSALDSALINYCN